MHFLGLTHSKHFLTKKTSLIVSTIYCLLQFLCLATVSGKRTVSSESLTTGDAVTDRKNRARNHRRTKKIRATLFFLRKKKFVTPICVPPVIIVCNSRRLRHRRLICGFLSLRLTRNDQTLQAHRFPLRGRKRCVFLFFFL